MRLWLVINLFLVNLLDGHQELSHSNIDLTASVIELKIGIHQSLYDRIPEASIMSVAKRVHRGIPKDEFFVPSVLKILGSNFMSKAWSGSRTQHTHLTLVQKTVTSCREFSFKPRQIMVL